jgi:predicted transcriptional regulator
MTDIHEETETKEFLALKTIGESKNPQLSQRQLAKALNMSVVMTNSIIKKLVSKDLLKISKLNGRNLSYALTPDGLSEIAKRSYRFLKRTIRNVVKWKDEIEEIIDQAKKKQFHEDTFY